MGNNSFGICRGCGKQILWIRTVAGKNMPVDPEVIIFKNRGSGSERIVLDSGEVVSAARCSADEQPDGYGHISHFASCPNIRRPG